MTTEIETLEKELQAIDDAWMSIVNILPDEDKHLLLQVREEIKEQRRQREELVKKCHPNDNHWPPNEECPVCQKIFQKLENEAKTVLSEDDFKDAKKLEDKIWEIFEKKYLKGPSNVSEQGQS